MSFELHNDPPARRRWPPYWDNERRRQLKLLDGLDCLPGQMDLPDGLCPICGAAIRLIGETTDGRLIGSCRDAFTEEQWLSNDEDEE